MEERIKQAIVRGVCALNRHTLTVFQPPSLEDSNKVPECSSHGFSGLHQHSEAGLGSADNSVLLRSQSQPVFHRQPRNDPASNSTHFSPARLAKTTTTTPEIQGSSSQVSYSAALAACLLPSVPHPASHYHSSPAPTSAGSVDAGAAKEYSDIDTTSRPPAAAKALSKFSKVPHNLSRSRTNSAALEKQGGTKTRGIGSGAVPTPRPAAAAPRRTPLE